MSKPTHQDATLMIQLAQWMTASGAQDASNWVFSDQFIPDYEEFIKKYPPGSDGYGKASAVLGWFETVGTLYKQGLFSEDLLFDWLAVFFVWDRMKGFALGFREQSGEPRMFENFEAMAKAQKEKIG